MSYIKAKEVLSLFNDLVNECVDKDDFYNRAFDVVDAMPTADVVEVRHGEWLLPLTNEPWRIGYFCRCSVCNKINNGHTLSTPNFCENCGAKMNR